MKQSKEDYKVNVYQAQLLELNGKEDCNDYYKVLLGYLKEYESEHPDQVDPNSPTQRLVGVASPESEYKIYHTKRQKVIVAGGSMTELNNFMSSCEDSRFVVYPLLFGVTIVADYADGELSSVGIVAGPDPRDDDQVSVIDITSVARGISNLPLRIERDVNVRVEGIAALPMSWYKSKEYKPEHGWAEFDMLAHGNAKSINDSGMIVKFDCLHGDLDTGSRYRNIIMMENLGLPNVFGCAHQSASIHEIINLMLKHASNSTHEFMQGAFVVAPDDKSDREQLTINAPLTYRSTLLQVYWEGAGGYVRPYVVTDPFEVDGTHESVARLYTDDVMELSRGDKLEIYEHPGEGFVARVIEHNAGKELFPVPMYCSACGARLEHDTASTLVCKACGGE